jgi:hypothetical protein
LNESRRPSMVAGTTSVTRWCVGEQRYLGPHAHSVIDTVHRVWAHNEGNGVVAEGARDTAAHSLTRPEPWNRIQCPEFGSDVGGKCGRIHRLGRDVGESRAVTGAVACRRWFFHHAATSANQAAARVVHCSARPAPLASPKLCGPWVKTCRACGCPAADKAAASR